MIRSTTSVVSIVLVAVVALPVAAPAAAQSPAISTITFHQPTNLKIDDEPLDDRYDLRLTLFDDATEGTQLSARKRLLNVEIVEGQVPPLDVNFGQNQFLHENRWIEFEARRAGSHDPFTTITPRVKVRAVPLALALPGLRTQFNAFAPNVIGGFSGNVTEADDIGVTIAGGGFEGSPNQALDSHATVGGGFGNTASGDSSVIAGGLANTASGGASAISGGGENVASGDFATIGGGSQNEASGTASTITGGNNNIASEDFSVIAGGSNNLTAGGNSAVLGGATNEVTGDFAAIVGGNNSSVSGDNSVVGGGEFNIITGTHSTIPGGSNNRVDGDFSFAAGSNATAFSNGAFIWADASGNAISTGVDNVFMVRASGGYILFTDAGATTGVVMSAGDNAWSPLSDRNVKENFKAIDTRGILQRVCDLPITEWNLISQDPSIRHVGPMAQDFRAAFGLGTSERHISTSDADGVAFAAIQGLNGKLDEAMAEQARDIARLQVENADLRDRLAALEAMVASLVTSSRSR